MSNPREILVALAAAELWVRETSKNQGPGVQKYWAATSYPDGYQNREPYCAAFVCWLIWTAIEEQSGFQQTQTCPAGANIPTDANVNCMYFRITL